MISRKKNFFYNYYYCLKLTSWNNWLLDWNNKNKPSHFYIYTPKRDRKKLEIGTLNKKKIGKKIKENKNRNKKRKDGEKKYINKEETIFEIYSNMSFWATITDYINYIFLE